MLLFSLRPTAHVSLARQALFGKEDQFAQYETLQYIAEVKYQVQGEAESLKSFTEAYRTLKLAGLCATTVAKQK